MGATPDPLGVDRFIFFMGQFAACHAALLCSSGSVLGQFRVCHVLVLDCHRVVRDGTAPLRSRPVQFCSVWYSRRSVPDSFRAIRVQDVLAFGQDGINSGPVPVLFRTILGPFSDNDGCISGQFRTMHRQSQS